MSRTGVEPKPPWQAVPRAVREAVQAALGSDVRRAARVWGGYSPAPTFRLRLVDGQGVFCKMVGPDDNEFSRAAFGREERIYGEMGDVLARWAPRLYGAVRYSEWRALLLEDLGPKSVPPWRSAIARGIAHDFTEFHRTTPAERMPGWLPQPGRYLSRIAQMWLGLSASGELRQVAGLAGERAAEAHRWLEAAVPALAGAGRQLVELGPPYALLHGDVRSDNLRWTRQGLRLFDWPHAGIGPPEYDLVAFAQSVTVEGGPAAEQIVDWYAARGPVRDRALDAAVAAVAGFFADGAWRPEIPGLPRLRAFQRAQFRVTLAWAAARLSLPAPEWLDGIA